MSNLYYLTRAFVKEYEPELIYYVKDRYERVLGSEICRVMDIDNCGLCRLRDTIKREHLNAVTISMLIGSSSVNTQKFIMLI